MVGLLGLPPVRFPRLSIVPQRADHSAELPSRVYRSMEPKSSQRILLMGPTRCERKDHLSRWLHDSWPAGVALMQHERESPCRAGKTSIKKVIFNKMSPHETLWLTSTAEVSSKGKEALPYCCFSDHGLWQRCPTARSCSLGS